MTGTGDWATPPVIALLREMWVDPAVSLTEMERRIGVSKNAIIGKAHRLHLPPRTAGITSGATQAAPAPAPGICRPAIVPPPPRPPPAARLPRVMACCWPERTPGTKDFRYCEGRAEPGRPYCAEHLGLAYGNRKPAGHVPAHAVEGEG